MTDKIKVEKIIIEIMRIKTRIEVMRIEKTREERRVRTNMIRRIEKQIGKKRDSKLI